MTLTVQLTRLAVAMAAIAIAAFVPGNALAQSAASFIVAIGSVQVVDAGGRTRAGERGGPLAPGDRVITGANGLAQIRFSDGAMLSVRANSDLKIEAHSFFGPGDTLATTVLQLLKGGLRAITGAVARQNRSGYRVVTPTATIGVRGTDFEAFYIPAPIPGGLAPPDEPGTYLRVSRGIAFLQTPQGNLDVQSTQIGFVPVAAAPPRLLPQTPRFMLQPSRPAPAPAPRSQPPQRSQGESGGPTVRQLQPVNPQQIDPSRTLTSPTTAPTLSPSLTSPTTISPTPIAPSTSPTLTAPATSPTTTSPTLSPGITSPSTISPSTSPTLSPGMTGPSTVVPPKTAPPPR
ncbi:MAG: FecR family protein [Betaproteobacteria bacterium]|nr:FecR family protein [Betaproteobacteria bacterium]